jgi:sterol 3beta-glucosyltransferase
MSSGSPQATVRLIGAALRETGQRAVIGSGWSGAAASDLPKNVLVVDHAPHDWLYERVAAVVHHGGAGTTAAGLRAGRPTLIIPHMSDQPFWGRRVHELGVGAKPIPRHRLTAETLAAGIRALVSDRAMAQQAAALGAQIRAEHGVENAVRWIERRV